MEIDTLLLKALFISGLEVVRSRTLKLGGKKRLPDPQVEFMQREKGKLPAFSPKLRSKYCFGFASMSCHFKVQAF